MDDLTQPRGRGGADGPGPDGPDDPGGAGEPAEPAPWERPPPHRSTRIFRMFTGLVFLGALGTAIATWIALSRPFDPGQVAALQVRLDAGTVQEAASLPVYPNSVIALTYHGVDDHDKAGSTLTRKAFGEHMAALHAAGYRTVRLTDVENLFAHRPVRLPRKALLLTFDDGELSNWTTVDPVLKQFGFNAVGFLTTSKIVARGTPSYYMSTGQVQALKATGRWEFGSHSHDLHTLTKIPGDIAAPMANRILVNGKTETLDHWRARVRQDLARSQKFFRATLGGPVTAFSYPFGETGRGGNTPQIPAELPALIREAGFSEAFTGEHVPTEQVNAITAQSPRWTLGRIGVRTTTSVADLLELIRGAIPTAPPHNLATLPWIGDLATCRRRSLDLVVGSDVYGSCLLSGVNTSQWTDYRVTTSISGLAPGTSAVIAVRDGAGAGHRGRAEIVVGAGGVQVRQQIGDGDTVVLRRAKITTPATARTVLIEVRGARLLLRVSGGAPLRVGIDPRLHEGGLKFEITAQGRRTLIFHRPVLVPLRAG